MKNLFAGVAVTAATMAIVTGAAAAGPPYCGTYATPSITAPSGASVACQSAVTKNTQKYVKSYLKTRGKCLAQGDPTLCPNADDDAKVQKAAIKATESIASACADTTGLGNSYHGVGGSDVGSCTLSQGHGTLQVFLGETHGNGGDASIDNSSANNTARIACQQAIDSATEKFLPAILKSVDKCIDAHIKAGTAASAGADCVGSLSPGGYTDAPDDEKTSDALVKAATKMQATIADACNGLSADQFSFLFSCPGATSLTDVASCAACSSYNAMFEIVKQQYSETGSFVTNAVGAIQSAVNAGNPGDKFLIQSGDYTEGVSLPTAHCSVTGAVCTAEKICGPNATHPADPCWEDPTCVGDTCNDACPDNVCGPSATNAGAACTSDGDCSGDTCVSAAGNDCESDGDNMQFVGCGAATDDRPRIMPPTLSPPNRGFFAAGVDGLSFQGVEVIGWSGDGIFVSGANGVSFRDVFGDGDNLSTPETDAVSTYAIFPVKSINVMVEANEVVNVRDAGIYVGQSHFTTMRHNLVHNCVAGMEIENSNDTTCYGNVTHDNTGGLLTFKLPGPEKQTSGNQHVFDNVSYSNNVPNFAIPNTTVSAVPRGTGMMVLSEDDSTFENNQVMKNDTYGMLVLDQGAVNALADNQFYPESTDPSSENLHFLNNRLAKNTVAALANGLHPDSGALFAGNWTWALQDSPDANGTCFSPAPNPTASATLNVSSFPACP